MLKGLIWFYVIDSRPLITLRHGYKKLVVSLFNDLITATDDMEKNKRLFPLFFQELFDQMGKTIEIRHRIVGDFIASMTES